jgi:hypothetical protein
MLPAAKQVVDSVQEPLSFNWIARRRTVLYPGFPTGSGRRCGWDLQEILAVLFDPVAGDVRAYLHVGW